MQCKMIDFNRQDTVIRDHFRSDIRIKYFVWGFKASLQPTGRRVAEQTQILMIYFSQTLKVTTTAFFQDEVTFISVFIKIIYIIPNLFMLNMIK